MIDRDRDLSYFTKTVPAQSWIKENPETNYHPAGKIFLGFEGLRGHGKIFSTVAAGR
jgi:hypothetical protein